MNYKNKWVVITGASSGMGIDYAEVFAEKGANIVLTARREQNLRELETKILSKYPDCKISVIPCDLSSEEGCNFLLSEISKQEIEVHTLINNAGYGIFGEFTEMDYSQLKNMLDLNIISLTYLTHYFVKKMKERNEGQILLVSSVGAYQPCPLYASYGASKSYVLHFGEALSIELANTNVRVSVLSPGMTETEFFERSGQFQDDNSLIRKILIMKSKPVVELAIRKLEKGVISFIPGFLNNALAFLNRLSPRKISALVTHEILK
ncbi:SDR family oxidoreductase [Bacteriovorax sp. Seq25_V]|uniref:SDR family NAD(P)-dependent oxidoreductase n=1 Tax=Bacteriovorax sp. Seq25_V TaxID=1201288 RepID=UPI00038A3B16|nr:SDR family oxidoreductase [Bacteriovorax sp. Seq25_V]EQC45328.1 KR domain protein [Bacteriovorax sp. Seq25_V]